MKSETNRAPSSPASLTSLCISDSLQEEKETEMADPQRQQQVNMEDSGQEQLPVMGAVQLPYMTAPYPSNQMMNTSTPMLGSQLPVPTSQVQHQLPYQQVHQQQQQHHLGQQLQMFWANQYHEIIGTKDFKNHSLPLARIKKIMKADEDVRMIAAEAPMLFAKACEMFILELTYRSWALAEENKRRTLLKNDIAGAITRTNAFDFLVDIVPKEELKDEVHTVVSRVGGLDDSLSYYYVPPHVGSLGMMMGKPDVDQGFSYNQQPQTYMSPQQICHQQQSMQEHPEDDQS